MAVDILTRVPGLPHAIMFDGSSKNRTRITIVLLNTPHRCFVRRYLRAFKATEDDLLQRYSVTDVQKIQETFSMPRSSGS